MILSSFPGVETPGSLRIAPAPSALKPLSCLHQPSAHEVEGLLGGEFADSGAVAFEGALDGLGFVRVGDGDVDQAYGFLRGCAGGSGDAGYAYSQGCAGAQADACGEGACDFCRDGSIEADELRRDTGEGFFEGVSIDDRSAEERARAAGDGGDALGDHAAGAAFGYGEGGLAQAEVVEDDLLERFTVRGVEPVFESFFEAAG